MWSAKAALLTTDSVSLKADMWISIHMDTSLVVSADQHPIGGLSFPNSHTAENITAVGQELMREWGICEKVRCLVTDAA